MAKTIIELRVEIHATDSEHEPEELLSILTGELGSTAEEYNGRLIVLRSSAYLEPVEETVPEEPQVPVFPTAVVEPEAGAE